MKHFYTKNIIAVIFTLLVSSSLFSQQNTMYWMKHLPQSVNTNPAKQPTCKFYLDIYVLPNFSFNVAHTGFTFDDIIMDHPNPTPTDSFMFDLKTLSDALGESRNGIDFETEFSLINIGFALRNKMYFTAGINYKINENFQYPRALLDVTNGNYRENGNALSFDFRQSFTSYREAYIGISKNYYNKLIIGGRLKFLNGWLNLDAKKMKLDWYTSILPDDIYDYNFKSDVEVNLSTPVAWEFEYDTLNNINGIEFIDQTFEPEIDENDIMGSIKSVRKEIKKVFPHNFGMAIDLGAEYNVNKNIKLSASVIDFGFIRWKTNTANLTQKGNYPFNGIDIGKYIENSNTTEDSVKNSLSEDYINELLKTFNPTVSREKYTTSLNTKIFLGGNYSVKKWLDFGLLYRAAIINRSLYSSGTASVNLNFLRGWSYTVSYTLIDRLANNIGMGLAYKIGPFQMYLITDNIAPMYWAAFDTPMADKWIRNTKRVNLAFGMNFTLCKNKHDRGLLE